MSDLIRSGRVLDLVLTVVGLEMLWLLATRAGRRRMHGAPDVLAHLCSAAGLLTAAHLIIVRAHWIYAGMALGAALLAHLIALRVRSRAVLPGGLAPPAPIFSSRLTS
jgi:hypothetical protein